MKFKISLADGWQQLHKRGTVILSSVLATVSAFGPVIRDAWHNVPDDLKSIIPAHAQQAIAYAILFASIVAVRYTAIRRVAKEVDDGTQ
ncbi:hypothetical protein [Paraburkholderia agricolaris]|uniref:DUF7940 domain-containing protein n=1 Tax=Paraburkholderia agricolaris TaxID=2152888 RepID=UPI0012924B4A|nr:hypothetical protein [Paraburkholderia agricolaris]